MGIAPVVTSQTQFLGFHVGAEEYGIGILRVREILEFDTVTRTPHAPPSIRGVINLRGRVVPVVDLAVKFGLAASVATKQSCVVVVEAAANGEEVVMGLLTDSVSRVLDLPPSEIEPPPCFGTRLAAECLLGLGRAGRKFVMLIDVDRLLTADEIEVAKA